ncbi:MAG: TIGR00282 family metallophosphoesterase [Planctomycetota bacterium]|jgi:metallophosphoesterase (TIGR00282 family)
MAINILCIGDVVGRAGRSVIGERLAELIREHEIEFVVCNAENAAGGSGLTPQIFEKLLKCGVDVVTLGDHAYRKRQIIAVLEKSPRIVRPANISASAAGKRWTVAETKSNSHRVGVACLLGQMFMGLNDSPWTAADEVLAEMPEDVKIRVIDFHAEASSEKIAMGWHLNGRASIVFGTHTHIPTADARVLDKGTAHISDVGMTGPYDSVLGRRKERVLRHLRTSMPARFEVARGDPRLRAVLVAVQPATGLAESIRQIEIAGQIPEGGAYDASDGQAQRKQ